VKVVTEYLSVVVERIHAIRVNYVSVICSARVTVTGLLFFIHCECLRVVNVHYLVDLVCCVSEDRVRGCRQMDQMEEVLLP